MADEVKKTTVQLTLDQINEQRIKSAQTNITSYVNSIIQQQEIIANAEKQIAVYRDYIKNAEHVKLLTEEEVLGFANSVRYGLSATVWTENLSRAHRVAARLESGIVWINCWLLRDLRTPFGGVKDSGMGREGGFEALRFFTEEKNVCIKL